MNDYNGRSRRGSSRGSPMVVLIKILVTVFFLVMVGLFLSITWDYMTSGGYSLLWIFTFIGNSYFL
jgi:hypothetical protein